jgi:hypothetical protein
VQKIFQNGFDLCLRPRLTNTASAQLAALLSCLQELTLRDGADVRMLKTTGKPYTTRDAYAALDQRRETSDPHGRRIWGTRVPNKVKVFAWLYFKDRLSARANLHAKHVLDSAQCERCASSIEDKHHTFFGCAASASVWHKIGFSSVSSLTDEEIWNFAPPSGLDAKLWPFVLLTLLWRLWDARNSEVFRGENVDSRLVITRVCDDFVIWRKRLRDEFVTMF